MKFRRKVIKGYQLGRTLGFPTLNFHPGNFSETHAEGVYKADVWIDQKRYRGALFFGKKTNHAGNVLELFVLDFSRQIYGQFVSFEVIRKIRGPKVFANLNELKKQIEEDVKGIV